MRAWNHALYPCNICFADLDGLKEVDSCELENLKWGDHTDRDYDEVCKAAEVEVTVSTKQEHSTIKAALQFDKRRQGCKGVQLQVRHKSVILSSSQFQLGGTWLKMFKGSWLIKV